MRVFPLLRNAGRGPLPAAEIERRGFGAAPNNDLYLFDRGSLKYISREHFQIERREAGRFVLRERGSACGTLVGNEQIGGEREVEEIALEDGNTIVVGGSESPYVFQFIVLDQDD